jgi:hypothetical protein
MFRAGDLVIRNCPGTLGHGSIGKIESETFDCYWVTIIEGKNRMEGWDKDAWSKAWCIPYITYNKEPDWEV